MNSRLTVAAHILTMIAWIEREFQRPATSDELAESIGTNPVVVRRILAQLKDARLIDSRRGVGGGSILTRDPKDITLRHAYEAVESDELLLGRHAGVVGKSCRVAPIIASYLEEVFGAAEEALKERLATIDVDTMSKTIVDRVRRRETLRGSATTRNSD